jgi:hypothetical protein
MRINNKRASQKEHALGRAYTHTRTHKRGSTHETVGLLRSFSLVVLHMTAQILEIFERYI